MEAKWVSYFFFFMAAVIHVGFFIIESFIFQKENGYKIFKMRKEDHPASKIWAFNQGFYNLFLAIGMFIGLYFVNKLEIRTAGTMVSFIGFSMIAASIVLYFSNKKLVRGALLQGLPPLIGFFFLAFHIAGRV